MLLPADYGLLALVGLLGLLGLFRGLSGVLAFIAGSVTAVFICIWGWNAPFLAEYELWKKGLAVALAGLLGFGLVRLLVKFSINKLVSQPSDAIFGCVLGILTGGLVIVGWALSGLGLEYSNLVNLIIPYVSSGNG